MDDVHERFELSSVRPVRHKNSLWATFCYCFFLYCCCCHCCFSFFLVLGIVTSHLPGRRWCCWAKSLAPCYCILCCIFPNRLGMAPGICTFYVVSYLLRYLHGVWRHLCSNSPAPQHSLTLKCTCVGWPCSLVAECLSDVHRLWVWSLVSLHTQR